MTPGRLLHRSAAWVCDAKSLERVVEPAIAEFQHECRHTHGAWLHARTLAVGYFALVKVIAVSAAKSQIARDRSTSKRTFGYLAAATLGVGLVVATIVIVIGGLRLTTARPAGFLLLILMTVPFALPIGTALGITLAAGGGEMSPRFKRGLVLSATAASLASMLAMLSVFSIANLVFGREQVGLLDTLRSTAAMFSDKAISRATWGYHMRWSMSVAPILAVMFTFALKSRWPAAPRAVILAACAGYLLLFALGDKLFTDFRDAPLLPLAWMPNMVVVAATLAVSARPRANSGALHS